MIYYFLRHPACRKRTSRPVDLGEGGRAINYPVPRTVPPQGPPAGKGSLVGEGDCELLIPDRVLPRQDCVIADLDVWALRLGLLLAALLFSFVLTQPCHTRSRRVGVMRITSSVLLSPSVRYLYTPRMVDRQSTHLVDSGQCTVYSVQCTEGSGQWTVDGGHSSSTSPHLTYS